MNNNPIKYIDPTGHVNQNACNYRKNPNCDMYTPEFTGSNWAAEEMTAIIVAYNLAIRAFGGIDNFKAAFGGLLTFEHVKSGSLGAKVVARGGGSLTIKIDSSVFLRRAEKMTWYALHEIGHVFDFAGANGDPQKIQITNLCGDI